MLICHDPGPYHKHNRLPSGASPWWFFIFVFAFTLVASGQKQTFDSATFTAPAGWERSDKGDSVTFTKEVAGKGFCVMILYRSIDASTDADKNFELSWDTLVREKVGVTAAPNMQPAENVKGWTTLAGYGNFDKDGIKGAVILATFTVGSKLTNLVILTNSDQYTNEISTFSDSITFKTSTTVAPTSPTPSFSGIGSPEVKADVWYSYRPALGQGQYTFQFITIFANGDALEYVPAEGLLGVNRTTRPQYGWGKRREVGNEVHVEYKDGTVRKMGKISATKMSYPPGSASVHYTKLRWVDGIKLEGEFSSDSPAWYKNGKLADIVFRSNGTFIDNGLSNFVFDANGNEVGRKDSGSGTYAIKDFTIVFTYSDGTVARRPFLLSVSDANNPVANAIFMGSYPFYRRI